MCTQGSQHIRKASNFKFWISLKRQLRHWGQWASYPGMAWRTSSKFLKYQLSILKKKSRAIIYVTICHLNLTYTSTGYCPVTNKKMGSLLSLYHLHLVKPVPRGLQAEKHQFHEDYFGAQEISTRQYPTKWNTGVDTWHGFFHKLPEFTRHAPCFISSDARLQPPALQNSGA